MAKKILTLFTLLNLSVLCGAESKNLFNGKDLTGWTGNPEFWKVENGIIVGETTNQKKTPGNTFLIWEGGNLGDFELTLKARVKGNNNSGIQYRSKVLNEKTWSVGGYQMDMHPAPNYLGMMYEERGRGIIAQRGQNVVIDFKGKRTSTGNPDKEKTDNLADWNEFKISAIGNKLTHMVNGKVTVDIEDNEEGKKSRSGVIALQLHAGGPMRLEVKDISLVRKDKKTSKNLNPRIAENVFWLMRLKIQE